MMRIRMRAEHAARGGFTLLEMMIGVAIFSVVGLALMEAVRMGHDSSTQVILKASSNSELRRSSAAMTDELAMTSAATITVTDLPDGNHQLDFQEPIAVGGVTTWGVDEPMLGVNNDWFIRYTVEAFNLGGALSRRLVRQVIDDTGAVRNTRIVAEGLRDGNAGTPGFSCAQVGEMWVMSIRTEQGHSDSQGKEMVFHVRARN